MHNGNNTRRAGSTDPGVEINGRRHRAHAHAEPRQEAETEPTCWYIHAQGGEGR